jgi:uncharacterized membrane protein
MGIAFGLHVLAAVIWVGGMFFAYMALRPVAADLLEPPLRMPLWRNTFRRFFVWVWLVVLTLPLTGYFMVFAYLGGMSHVGMHIHVMQGLGIVMILLFMHLYFAPYQRLSKAVDARDFNAASGQLATIRKIIATNLSLGLIVVAVASVGRYW